MPKVSWSNQGPPNECPDLFSISEFSFVSLPLIMIVRGDARREPAPSRSVLCV